MAKRSRSVTPPLDARVSSVSPEPANDAGPLLLDVEGPNAAAFVASVLDAVRDVGAARRELLGRLRDALERGDDQAALTVAAQLVGLAE